jgi:hypothetical protein
LTTIAHPATATAKDATGCASWDAHDAATSTVGTGLKTVSDEDQYLQGYLVLWPHVNLSPLAPGSPTSFDWHHIRTGEKVTVCAGQQPGGIGFAHPAAMVLGYYTPSPELRP